MSQQQTVLRVQFDNVNSTTGITQYDFLDIYSSIPLLINKSFAELGDIGKRNSDYSVGVLLPGSKRNNKFFENYFNVDAQSLYFNPNQRVPCQILINDESYFTGYMRLNKVSVLDSKVEYDVTLYSTPAELYGSIGNNLMKDLNFADEDYTFNHVFNLENVTKGFTYDNFSLNQEEPYPYFYPVVHNGYLYTGDTVNFTGGTILSRTNLYTSTGPLGSYVDLTAAYADGVQQFRINSPTQGLYNNQLKPGLNIWSLLKLMFKTYGYSITSDFFNTPWMKTLYMFGYFSSDLTKFAFSVSSIQTLPLEGVEVFFVDIDSKVNAVVAKLGTGIPCFCASDINITLNYVGGVTVKSTIPYGTSGLTFNTGVNFVSGSSSDVPNGTTLKYLPVNVGDTVPYVDGDYVDFSLVVDQNIKQIDVLSSIAKKFNLVLIPDPNNGYNIRIEPYDYFIGTGEVHNWTNLISYDKGFTVEPALNYIESEIQFTDQEDNDEGNRLFKINNNRIYGQNYIYNPTSFKSSQKRIDTIFSPELIRKWDSSGTTNNGNIGLPLGINYAGSNNQIETATTEKVNWIYKGVKTKPKLFWWLGCQNPFLDVLGETYNASNFYKTYNVYIQNSSGSTYYQLNNIPVISHTMPMGNPDKNKINNDSQCILFNSELPANVDIGVQPFNTYTENDAYSSFYEGRITNLYDPNTRVLSGYFNLSYADLKNLQPEDLIKVNEQHFVVSKIEGFNLTNRELTKVELIQFNGQPNTYTDRYFQYYYCDYPYIKYSFKTDFTNSNLLNTNFGWSLYYDYQIGTLNGTQSGFTSTFKDTIGGQDVYIPYYIYEVTEDTYNSSPYSWDCDTLHQHFYSQPYGPFINSMPTFWINSGSTQTGINLFTDCADFESARTSYGILTGSSTTYGASVCITPSPTPTITSTPTPTSTPSNQVYSGRYMAFSDRPVSYDGNGGTPHMYLSSDYGVNFTQYNGPNYDPYYTPNNTYNFRLNNDASKIWSWADNINEFGNPPPTKNNNYTTIDSGTTWNYSGNMQNDYGYISSVPEFVAQSYNTNYVYRLGLTANTTNSRALWTSNNAGNTFTKSLVPPGMQINFSPSSDYFLNTFNLPVISNSGQYILFPYVASGSGATFQNFSFFSNDYGQTITALSGATSVGKTIETSGYMSLDASTMIISQRIYFTGTTYNTKKSNDYGVTWNQWNPNGSNNTIWMLDMNYNGSIMCGKISTDFYNKGNLKLSLDSGATFTDIQSRISADFEVKDVVVSEYGDTIMVVGQEGSLPSRYKVYVSNDFGSTFNLRFTDNEQLYGITMNKNIGGIAPSPTPTRTTTPTVTKTPTLTPTPTQTSVTPTPTPTNAPSTLNMTYTWTGAGTMSKTFEFYYRINGGSYTLFTGTTFTAASGSIDLGTINLPVNLNGTNPSIEYITKYCKASGTLTRDVETTQTTLNAVYVRSSTNNTDFTITTCPTQYTGGTVGGPTAITNGSSIIHSTNDIFK